MKFRIAQAALALATSTSLVHAQSGHMMDGHGRYGDWMSHGGMWIPILLIVIAGLLVLIVLRSRK